MLSTHNANQLYEQYSGVNVLFTKETVRIMGIIPKNIVLKCGPYHFPAVIRSASMIHCSLVVQNSELFAKALQNQKGKASIRFATHTENSDEPQFFFISGSVRSFEPFPGNEAFSQLEMDYASRAPEALIAMLGPIVEANSNIENRSEERIEINKANASRYNIDLQQCSVKFAGQTKRRCLIKDLSLSGASFIAINENLPLGEPIELAIIQLAPPGAIIMNGVVAGCQTLDQDRSLIAASIEFNKAAAPLDYKLLISAILAKQNKRANHT